MKRVLTIDCSLESIQLFLIEKDFFMVNCNSEGYGRGTMNPGTFCALFVGMCYIYYFYSFSLLGLINYI
jgi:hypothetical protein